MKSRKRTAKTLAKDLIIKSFLAFPIPMVISKAKDGTFVEVNESGIKLWGLSRKQLIGHTSTELGFFIGEQRKLLLDEVRKQGFARNVSVLFKTRKQGLLKVLIDVFPFKMGKESFFHCTATDIGNKHIKNVEKCFDDKFIKISLQRYNIIKEKLKEYPLTPRQREIALLFVIGHSNSEIAKKLCISIYTVKDHQKDIFKIIGIKNRRELFPALLNLR